MCGEYAEFFGVSASVFSRDSKALRRVTRAARDSSHQKALLFWAYQERLGFFDEIIHFNDSVVSQIASDVRF